MGLAYRLVRPQPTMRELYDIKKDPSIRATTSPFGVTPEQYERNPPLYVGSAVAWKGTNGIDDMFKACAARYGAMSAAALKNGLQKAIAISKKYAGIKGTVLYKGKLYPKKCIEQKKG